MSFSRKGQQHLGVSAHRPLRVPNATTIGSESKFDSAGSRLATMVQLLYRVLYRGSDL